jgi:hypothetical protein
MATVATVFTRAPWIRTPRQVVESLFNSADTLPAKANSPPRPEHKRVWASLIKGKATVIGEVAAEVLHRDPKGAKVHVALTDGERALQILVTQKLQVTLILDLLHVLEKLWKAAYVFHAEGSVEAQLWVRLRAEKILEGYVSQVVQGIRQMVTKHGFRGSKRKTLRGVANYLYRNRGQCTMTSIWPRAGLSPVVRWRERARTSLRTAWNDQACAGPRLWPRPSLS